MKNTLITLTAAGTFALFIATIHLFGGLDHLSDLEICIGGTLLGLAMIATGATFSALEKTREINKSKKLIEAIEEERNS